MITVVEEVVVLAYRDDTGRNRVNHLHFSLAGAVLVDLFLRERVDIGADRRVRVIDASPTGDAVLDACLQRIGDGMDRKAKTWVKKLGRGVKKPVLAGLAEKRILAHQREVVIGLFPVNRYLPLDGRVKPEITSRLETAMSRQAASDTRTAALAGIIYGGGMHKAALPRHPRAVRKVLRDISAGPFSTEATRQAAFAVRKAISDTNAAVAGASGGGGGG